MRLKSFSARSMSEVMSLVRQELGEDAIIVTTRKGDDGTVRVTAALEQPGATELPPGLYGSSPIEETVEFLRRALDYHGVRMKTAIRLLDSVRYNEVEDPVLALAAAVDEAFRFAPLPSPEGRRPLMLIGPPGAGKTVSVAKLAARIALKGQRINVVTTDTVRAGGVQQLSALTGILGLEAVTADTPSRLFIALSEFDSAVPTLIDTAGVNPFDKTALARLQEFVDLADAETVLVLPAGFDAREAAETALAFSSFAPARLLPTRLDAARRYGGLLAAAEAGRLAFTEAGTAPQIAQGFSPLNPVGIARLLLRDPLSADADLPLAEAAL